MYDFNNYKDVVRLFEGSINLLNDFPKLKDNLKNYSCGDNIYNYIHEQLTNERIELIKQHGPIVYYRDRIFYISILFDNKEIIYMKPNETIYIDVIKSNNIDELKKYNLENAIYENDGYVYFILCQIKENLNITKIDSLTQISKKDAELLFTRMKEINNN